MMKKIIALLLTLIFSLGLGACNRSAAEVANTQPIQTEPTTQKVTESTEGSSIPAPKETTEAVEAPIQLNYELIGPWHLDQNKNDLAAFADSLELFPG